LFGIASEQPKVTAGAESPLGAVAGYEAGQGELDAGASGAVLNLIAWALTDWYLARQILLTKVQ